MADKPLSGLTVVSFESRHAKTLADLIAIQGGSPVSAPALKEVPLENNPQVFSFADAWFAGKIDVLILLTGVGTRALVDVLKTRYDEARIFDRLKRTVIVPRGPKPVRVLNEWKIPFAFMVPEPNTWKELLAEFDAHAADVPLRGKNAAVQEYGVPNPELTAGLEARGANVTRVPVYRWELPDDTAPLEKAVERIGRSEIDIAVFTTAVQADHLFQIWGRSGKPADALRAAFRKTVVASVGPDTSAALRRNGLEPDLEPESPKMGPLVKLVAEKAKDVLKAKR